jgi:hypothetical protein
MRKRHSSDTFISFATGYLKKLTDVIRSPNVKTLTQPD